MVDLGPGTDGGGSDSDGGGGQDSETATFPGSEDLQYDIGGDGAVDDTQQAADETTAGGGGIGTAPEGGGSDPARFEDQIEEERGTTDTGEPVPDTSDSGSDGGGDGGSLPSDPANDDRITGPNPYDPYDGGSTPSDGGGGRTTPNELTDVPEGAAEDPFADDPRVPDYYEDQIERDQPQSVDQPFVEPNPPESPPDASDTPGDVIGTSVEESGLVSTEVPRSSDQLQQQASAFERELLMENPNLGPREVDINVSRIDGEYQLTPVFADDFRREQAASQFTEEMGRDITVGDIQLRDDGPTLTDEAQSERIAQQYETQTDVEIAPGDVEPGRAAPTFPGSERLQYDLGEETEVTGQSAERLAVADLEQQAEQQLGRDVEPGQDFTVTQQGDQYSIQWSDEFLEEQATRTIEEQAGREELAPIFETAGAATDVATGAAEAIGLPGGDIEAPTVEDVPADVARQFSPIQAGEDFNVEQGQVFQSQQNRPTTTEGLTVNLTDEYIQEQRQEQLEAAEAEDDGGGIAEAVLGPPGQIESGIAAATVGTVLGSRTAVEEGAEGVVSGTRDASAEAAATVGPVAGDLLGDALEMGGRGMLVADPQAPAEARDAEARADYVASGQGFLRAPEDEVTDTTFAELIGEGAGQGAVDATIGLPAGAIDAGSLGVEAAEFTAAEIGEEGIVEGGRSSLTAGGEFAYQAGETVAQQAAENPAYFGGMIAGGVVGGAATTPIRVSRLDVPTRDGGATAVRGARIREPAIVRPLTGRQRGRTVLGARGLRPSLGAPSLRNVDVDYADLGSTGTFTAEAMSSFEADIFRSTAGDIGGEAATRFSEAERIQRQATRAGRQDFQFDTAEAALAEARAVPESAVPDVADALRDVDATVFGSVATRARVEGFRQPRDIDITLRESRQAPKSSPIEEQFPESGPRLQEALEGEQATVGDVFDIKTEAEAPGRAFGGEEIKFGFESMEPDTLGGVRFNPAEEELVRKAGASAFLRGEGAAGTPELDVGPEPRRPQRTDVREKDVTDTAAIAEELLGEGSAGEFQSAFGLAGESVDVGTSGLATTAQQATPDIEAGGGLRGLFGDTAEGGARTDVETQQRVDVDDGADAQPTPADEEVGGLEELFRDDRAQLGGGRRGGWRGGDSDAESAEALTERISMTRREFLLGVGVVGAKASGAEDVGGVARRIDETGGMGRRGGPTTEDIGAGMPRMTDDPIAPGELRDFLDIGRVEARESRGGFSRFIREQTDAFDPEVVRGAIDVENAPVSRDVVDDILDTRPRETASGGRGDTARQTADTQGGVETPASPTTSPGGGGTPFTTSPLSTSEPEEASAPSEGFVETVQEGASRTTSDVGTQPSSPGGGVGGDISSSVWEPVGGSQSTTQKTGPRSNIDGSPESGVSTVTAGAQSLIGGGSADGGTDQQTPTTTVIPSPIGGAVTSPFGGAPGDTEPTTTPSPTGTPAPGGQPPSPGAIPGPGGIPSPTTSPIGGGVPGFNVPISPPTATGGDDPTTRTIRMGSGDEGEDPEEFRPEAPTGQEFFNPVATGQSFLFGDFGSDGGDSDGQNPDPSGLFFG